MPNRAALVALVIALGCSHTPPTTPAPPGTPAASERAAADVGGQAPAAQLTRTSGDKVALNGLLHQHAQTVVVFYRGFW
jgi:hypothetical protein